MGNAEIFICPHCGREIWISEGLGFADCPETVFTCQNGEYPNLQERMESPAYQQTRELLNAGASPADIGENPRKNRYGQNRYICPHCHILQSRFTITLQLPDGTLFTPEYHCEHCNAPLRLYTRRRRKQTLLHCKNCNTTFDIHAENITRMIAWVD